MKSEYFGLYRRGLITREANDIIKKSVNKEVYIAKKNYYKNLFSNNTSDVKKNWDTIRSLMGKFKSKNEINLKDGETLITNEQMVSERFIQYFSNIANRLDSDLGPHVGAPLRHIPVNRNSLFLSPVDESEIIKIIHQLKNSKTNIDSMPVKIFKSISHYLSAPISKLVNESFSQGIFPDILKIARITPVYKSGSKFDCSNYRPISSLHYMSKLLEKCMSNRIVKFFERFSLFSNSQYGFMGNRSTLDALIDLTEAIYDSLDQKKHHISILIDMTKAFDTVNHNILLGKLERYGVRDLPLLWIKSFLSNRRSYVGVRGAESERVVSNISVPQGSTISPILFLIYINDLPSFCPDSHTTLFADDTTLSYSNPDLSSMFTEVNNELILVENWMNMNRLTLNLSKTECIIFSNRNPDLTIDQVNLNNINVNFSPNCKFLGVLIDSKLNFRNHIDCVLGKLVRSARILYRIRNYLPLKSRLNFYYAFVYSHLSYSVLIWGNTSNVHLRPLITQHKRIIRLITNSRPRDHTSPLFHRLNILKFHDVFKFHLMVYMYKSINAGEFAVGHTLNTRSRDLAAARFHRLTQTQRAVSYAGPTTWNTLPSEIRNSHSLPVFKRKLKSYFIDQYLP